MRMTSTLERSLLVAATILNGILAGGSLIKSVVELPARRTIGLAALAAYHRAADLRTGGLIYPALGLGAPALAIALGITFAVDPGSAHSGRFVCLPRCRALGGPRCRDEPCGPEPAQAPLRDTRRAGPRTPLPRVHAMADRAGDFPGRGFRSRGLGVGLPPPSRPMTETRSSD